MMGRVTTTKPPSTGDYRFVGWFVAATILSALLHGYFLGKSRSWKVCGFTAESFDEIVPRTFHMKRVEIDPETLREAPAQKTEKQTVKPGSIPVPEDLPSVVGSGKMPVVSQMSSELPEPAAIATGFLDKAPGAKNLAGLMEGSTDVPGPLGDPLANLPVEPREGEGTERMTGFSSLDELLEGTGSLSTATAPILMPTDLLFEYDAAELRPDAEMALKKLGALIARNPGSHFRIEGHTDSFGGEDYNMALSLRRAEAVRNWLVTHAGIAPQRITTEGLGKTRLLVSGTRSIGEQRLNRRVEIVITEGGKP